MLMSTERITLEEINVEFMRQRCRWEVLRGLWAAWKEHKHSKCAWNARRIPKFEKCSDESIKGSNKEGFYFFWNF